MNIVALIGNVASEPDARTTSAGGRRVCTFRLAVSRPGGEEADFFTIATWERQAEVCEAYLSVGRRVAIEGRLHHGAVCLAESDSHEIDRTVQVVASRVQLLGAARPAAADAS